MLRHFLTCSKFDLVWSLYQNLSLITLPARTGSKYGCNASRVREKGFRRSLPRHRTCFNQQKWCPSSETPRPWPPRPTIFVSSFASALSVRRRVPRRPAAVVRRSTDIMYTSTAGSRMEGIAYTRRLPWDAHGRAPCLLVWTTF